MPVLSYGFFYIKYPEEIIHGEEIRLVISRGGKKEPAQWVRVLLEMIRVISIWEQLYNIMNILKNTE